MSEGVGMSERVIELIVVVEGLTKRQTEHRAKLMAASLRKRVGVLNVIVSDIRSDEDDVLDPREEPG